VLCLCQAWCVMGNCFSLQKEHDNALQSFQRAIQVDRTFTYAYTLCGHEHCANEDFEKGLNYYRTAHLMDPRHYNALYGIGQIYFRQVRQRTYSLLLQVRQYIVSALFSEHCFWQTRERTKIGFSRMLLGLQAWALLAASLCTPLLLSKHEPE
jgi:anaphase-promoting complex subunit 3